VFDYGNFSGPARRRSPRRPSPAVAIIVLVLLVAGGYLLVRHPAAVASPARITRVRQPTPLTSPGGHVTAGICIDPTTSTVTSFPYAIRADVARAVRSVAETAVLPTTARGGGAISAPAPGLDIAIRQVDTTSFSSAATRYAAAVSVPSVPGLNRSRPTPLSPNYASNLSSWSSAYQQVSAARKAAAAAAVRAARTIAAMPLDRTNLSLSGISACMSGLLLTAPGAGRHVYVLASDLEENVPSQLAGSFHGAPLLIVQACDSGDAAYCQGLLAHFSSEMRHLHVGPITMVRPEVAQQAIRDWMLTGGNSP
jgi:hypothetical protein